MNGQLLERILWKLDEILNVAPDPNIEEIRDLITQINGPKQAVSLVSNAVVTIPIGATEVSVFNNGDLTGSVNGTVIPAGVTRNFGFKNPIETTISVDGTGTELLIDYML